MLNLRLEMNHTSDITFAGRRKSYKPKGLESLPGLFAILDIILYLLEPALIMAQRKPMVAVAESCAIKRRVPGDNQ